MYPITLKLQNQKSLIVGGGSVAERKVIGLLMAGSSVSVVAPNITDGLRRLAEQNEIRWTNRAFQARDLDGCFLVIAATDSSNVNSQVYAEAVSRGLLINCVDDPERCNFYVPAVVRRGSLQITVSTAGASPYFAKRLRRYLEEKLYIGIENDLQELGRIRKQIREKYANVGQQERSVKMSEEQETIVNRILGRMEGARSERSD